MLLRSSSTPVLGSLLSSNSFTDSPNHHHEPCHALKHLPPPTHHHKLSFHQSSSFNLSCSSSPISPSFADLERQNKGLIRRVQSEGNLEDLAYASCNNNEERFSYMDHSSKRYSLRQRCLQLETIPSFSLSMQTGLREEEEDVEESDVEDEERYDEISVMMTSMKVSREMDRVCRVSFCEEGKVGNKEMYLAKGLGVDGIGGGCRGGGNGGGGDSNSMGSDRNDGDNDNHEVEEYYKKMVQQNPGSSLFLRNYAQFLYQSKQDREGAEEYYSRAILADPNDGEVLSQYGKLVWELHHDEERASSYFERAVQASPEDSHVQAAYASFLWDTEEDEDGGSNDTQCLPQHFHVGAMATTSV